MAPHRDGVVVSLTEGKDVYVQRFNQDGGLPGRIGVRLARDWIQWRVLRTIWR